ncbi:ribosomal protein [Rhizoctonia solani]|uniref:Ribosomal protein n=1 Tax=Rhizoctonia solani TaxID=456999 RepID=A0A8H7IH24_9AGAM|nr:ribosomal protein [Rhizoctonia solani]
MSLILSSLRAIFKPYASVPHPTITFSRARSQLAPRRVRGRRSHWRLWIEGQRRRHASYGQAASSAEVVIKRKLKIIKTSQIWMRVFPDLPVCVKGNETRMGRVKVLLSTGHAVRRVPTGRVVFEIGGGIREEIARDALRLAATKLPVLTEFISRSAGPKLGAIDLPPVTPKPITGASYKIVRKPLQPISVIDQEALKVPAGEVVI